ncbi:xylulokinase [Salinicoccus roseus]|uniref:Xylulose kinase n=1 Tax=Salinicoccus roseus TaxID=45670 RepID=A0A265E7S0_9STAP|nr:xylulokinase [Salinicoccus roseus]OZT77550.1 xylulokinase [Salinicoccus roseus]
MAHVLGVDLGTSSIKVIMVDEAGTVVKEAVQPLNIFHEKSGYSEQDPEEWVEKTLLALKEIGGTGTEEIEALSFSGQMHGLVLVGESGMALRNAILWNDTRTTKECGEIIQTVGSDRLVEITKNAALEGFTLPKLLWVKKHEPEMLEKAYRFLLPKDYLRYRLTGELNMEYSDAAGTLLLDVQHREWSRELCEVLSLDFSLCPPLVESTAQTGTLNSETVEATGLSEKVKVFAGGADNACGAIGAGILAEGDALCSIGTSGVVLSYESTGDKDFGGAIHYFNHGAPGAFYTMGVTLAAGDSLSWFKNTFAPDTGFEELLAGIRGVPAGANGLLFTPYISGERTPHIDSSIRGGFNGIDTSHTRDHFMRAVVEGITFSLKESLEIIRNHGKQIDRIISIGGGAKNAEWLQIQADVFNAEIVKLKTEQGPAMGAAMIAAVGSGWFDSLKACAETFMEEAESFKPSKVEVEQYEKVYELYKQVYPATRKLNHDLMVYK